MPSLSLKPITPKNLPSTKEYLKAVTDAAQKTARLTGRDLESTTRTWKHKPQFEVTVTETNGDYSVAAGTDDQRYKWVNDGTRPHIIRPRRSRFLRFRVGGSPKTTPNVIGSKAGAQGTDWRTAQEIHHPGTTARNFTKRIQERRQKTLEQETSQNLAKVARKQA